MTRAPHAFAAAENRRDREKLSAKAAAERADRQSRIAAVIKTTADGLLGGYSEDWQADLCDRGILELGERLKALRGAPAAQSALGAAWKALGDDIEGPKTSARKAAEKDFDRLTKGAA